MVAAELGHQDLPLRAEPRPFAADLRSFEIRQSRIVALACSGIENGHAQGPEDSRRHPGKATGKALGCGFGYLMAQPLEFRIAGASQSVCQARGLLDVEP